MKKIAIINQKGGSGKTTLAALVALGLAAREKSVLCVDLDPQGGLSMVMDQPGPGMFEKLSFTDIEPSTVKRDGLVMDILRADHRLDRIAYSVDDFALRDILNAYHYDYAVLDCPPTMMGTSRAAALVSDMVLTPSDVSIMSIGPTMYSCHELQRMKVKPHVILVNREPGPQATGYLAGLYHQYIADLGKFYQGRLDRNATMQKMAGNKNHKFTKVVRERLEGILQVVGL